MATVTKKSSEITAKASPLVDKDRFMLYNPDTKEIEYATPVEIQTKLLGTGVTVGDTDDGDILSVAGVQAVKNKSIASNCTIAVLENDTAITVGTDKLVTVTGIQTLANKTLKDPTITGVATLVGTVLVTPTLHGAAISGESTIDDGCTITTPYISGGTIAGASITDPAITGTSTIGAGCTLTSPALVAPTITGAMTVADGATLTTPIIASLKQAAGKTLIMPAPSGASDTLVSLTNTQTLTNKTLTAPVITAPTITGVGAIGTGTVLTGVTIDATSTLNGVAVSTALGAKANAITQTTHTAYLTVTTTSPGTTGSVTDNAIFDALALTINGADVDENNYYIPAFSVVPTLYLEDAGTYVYTAMGVSSQPTFTMTLSSTALVSIALAGLTTDSTYILALTFKIAALA